MRKWGFAVGLGFALGACSFTQKGAEHRSLEGVRTELEAVRKSYERGEPVILSLTLVNHSGHVIQYGDPHVDCRDSFEVLGPDGAPVPCRSEPRNTFDSLSTLGIGESVVLADKLDISAHYRIAAAGTYQVRFRGGIVIRREGQPVRLPWGIPQPDPELASNAVRVTIR